MGYFNRDTELAHHGILGQKWGVRRFEKAGGGLTAAGKTRYNTDSNGNYKKAEKAANHKGLSDKQKKALKIGAAVATTALATYGVYKVSQLNKKAKAGLSELDKIDAKVLLDRSNDYRKNAMNLAEAARKSNKEGRADVAKSLLETSNSMLNRGNYDKTSADKLLERAQKANYSLREKKLYLQSQSDSFSGTDKLIMDLLKKNSTTLSSLGF